MRNRNESPMDESASGDDTFCKIRFILTPIGNGGTCVEEVEASLSTDSLHMLTQNEEVFRGFIAVGVAVDAARLLESNEVTRAMTKAASFDDKICISECKDLTELNEMARCVADLDCLGLICNELPGTGDRMGLSKFPLPVFRVLDAASITSILKEKEWSSIEVEVTMAEGLPISAGTNEETASHEEMFTNPSTSIQCTSEKELNEENNLLLSAESFPTLDGTAASSGEILTPDESGRSDSSFPDDEGQVDSYVRKYDHAADVTPKSADMLKVSLICNA
jgi:hypothetical protein